MLGSIYFYVLLLVILIVLIGIAIANAIYFADIYNNGSENLSQTQSQQLIILNIVVVILLAFCSCFVVYMMSQKSDDKMINEELQMKALEKRNELDSKLQGINDFTIQREQRQNVKTEMFKLEKAVKKPHNRLKKESSKMKRMYEDELNDKESKIVELEEELGEMEKQVAETEKSKMDILSVKDTEIESLKNEIDNHKEKLDEMDKDLKLKADIIAARESKISVLSEGLFEDNEKIPGIKKEENIFDEVQYNGLLADEELNSIDNLHSSKYMSPQLNNSGNLNKLYKPSTYNTHGMTPLKPYNKDSSLYHSIPPPINPVSSLGYKKYPYYSSGKINPPLFENEF